MYNYRLSKGVNKFGRVFKISNFHNLNLKKNTVFII